jgi:hypothetical protein
MMVDGEFIHKGDFPWGLQVMITGVNNPAYGGRTGEVHDPREELSNHGDSASLLNLASIEVITQTGSHRFVKMHCVNNTPYSIGYK